MTVDLRHRMLLYERAAADPGAHRVSFFIFDYNGSVVALCGRSCAS